MTITSLYLLIAALINLYFGFTLFFSGAVALAFEGPGAAMFGGQTGTASIAVDSSSGTIALFGAFLLAVGAIMVVTAIELYARKSGARTRTALVALLSIARLPAVHLLHADNPVDTTGLERHRARFIHTGSTARSLL